MASKDISSEDKALLEQSSPEPEAMEASQVNLFDHVLLGDNDEPILPNMFEGQERKRQIPSSLM